MHDAPAVARSAIAALPPAGAAAHRQQRSAVCGLRATDACGQRWEQREGGGRASGVSAAACAALRHRACGEVVAATAVEPGAVNDSAAQPGGQAGGAPRSMRHQLHRRASREEQEKNFQRRTMATMTAWAHRRRATVPKYPCSQTTACNYTSTLPEEMFSAGGPAESTAGRRCIAGRERSARRGRERSGGINTAFRCGLTTDLLDEP